MVNTIKRWFGINNQPIAFDAGAGNQRIKDPMLLLNAQRFYAGLRREDKLALFYTVAHSQPLAVGALSVLTRMVNSRVVFKSGNPAVDRRCKEIWQQINGHETNSYLLNQALTYGYSCGEINFPNNQIESVCVPDSPMVRFVANEYGKVTDVIQLAGTVFAPTDPKARIPADKFIIYRNAPESTFDYYGNSMFFAVLETLQYLTEVLRASISVINRCGSPRFMVTVDNTGITPEQLKDRIEIVKARFSQLSEGNASDIYLVPGCDVKVIGGETLGIKTESEVRSLIQNYLAAVCLPAPLLNVVSQAAGGAESFIRQQIISLQSQLDTIQDGLANAWNRSFWRIASALERFPVPAVLDFENVRLLEQLLEEQSFAAHWQNSVNQVKAGIRPPEWLAQQVGADTIYDLAALSEYVEQQRISPDKSTNMNGETNANGQTKYTDKVASSKTTG